MTSLSFVDAFILASILFLWWLVAVLGFLAWRTNHQTHQWRAYARALVAWQNNIELVPVKAMRFPYELIVVFLLFFSGATLLFFTLSDLPGSQVARAYFIGADAQGKLPEPQIMLTDILRERFLPPPIPTLAPRHIITPRPVAQWVEPAQPLMSLIVEMPTLTPRPYTPPSRLSNFGLAMPESTQVVLSTPTKFARLVQFYTPQPSSTASEFIREVQPAINQSTPTPIIIPLLALPMIPSITPIATPTQVIAATSTQTPGQVAKVVNAPALPTTPTYTAIPSRTSVPIAIRVDNTPTLQPTRTPTPSLTPQPSATPTIRPSSTVTLKPTRTATLQPTPTLKPTKISTATTPPTKTPKPTKTPRHRNNDDRWWTIQVDDDD